LLGLVSVHAASVQILGAVRMLQHRAYSKAIASSLVPCFLDPVWFFSLPLASWRMVCMRKPAVVEFSFRGTNVGAAQAACKNS